MSIFRFLFPFFIFVGLILFSCQNETKKKQNSFRVEKKEVEKKNSGLLIENKSKPVEVFEKPHIKTNKISFNMVNILFPISGELVYGQFEIKEGLKFKKNELLFRINNRDRFELLSGSKNKLAALLPDFLKELSNIDSLRVDNWKSFLELLKPNKILPSLPINVSSKELELLKKFGISELVIKISKDELEMEKFFYLAPFDGEIIHCYTKNNQRINKNQIIAEIREEK